MRLSDLLDPISVSRTHLSYMSNEDALIGQIDCDLENGFDSEEIIDYDVAIVGINDGKNSPSNEGCQRAPSPIRSNLSGLRKTDKSLKVVDLGNIKGATLNDRYFALEEVIRKTVSAGVCVIVLGGGQDYIIPIAKALTKCNDEISLSIVDAKIDLLLNTEDFSSQTFLTQLNKDCKSHIFDLNLLGVQKYLIGCSQEQKIKELGWDYVRLKDLRGDDIIKSEPYLRDSDIVGIDVGAIQGASMPYFTNINVNGLTSFEVCKLGWYAGIAENVKAFAIQEFNPDLDVEGKGAMLCAQIAWHFIDGMSHKMRDIPSEGADNYKISVVHLQDFSIDVRFYSNKLNDRWWIEVPWKENKRMLACDKSDYLLAQNGELPDKWWKFFKKGNE